MRAFLLTRTDYPKGSPRRQIGFSPKTTARESKTPIFVSGKAARHRIALANQPLCIRVNTARCRSSSCSTRRSRSVSLRFRF